MRGRSQFGDAMFDMFNEQLSAHKITLLDLYKKRTKKTSEREASRFRYLSGMKSKIQSMLSAITSKVFSTLTIPEVPVNDFSADRYGDMNIAVGMQMRGLGAGFDSVADAQKAVQSLIADIQGGIPMVNLQGAALGDWWQNPGFMGGNNYVGFLSPLTHLFNEPYTSIKDGINDRPPYKIWGEYWLNQTIAELMNSNWLVRLNHVYNPDLGIEYKFHLGIAPEYWEAYSKQNGHPEYIQYLDFVNSVLLDTYPSGTLKSVLEEAQNLLVSIIVQTKELISLQFGIDEAEASLRAFVEEYKQYFNEGETADSIMSRLLNEAESPLAPPQETVTTVVGVQPAAKKSNWLPFAAAAAGILFLTTKDK